VPVTLVSRTRPSRAARSSKSASMSWMSIFIRRDQGDAASPANCPMRI
jgi:hypothetical protein